MPEFHVAGNRTVNVSAEDPVVSIFILVSLALDITCLVIGIIRKDQCPVDYKITLYLIVAGSLGLSSKILPYINKAHWVIIDFVNLLTYFFEFIWMVIGSVWIYSIYKPNFDPKIASHCDKTAYLVAFWIVTVQWGFIALLIIVTFCFLLFKGGSDRENTT